MKRRYLVAAATALTLVLVACNYGSPGVGSQAAGSLTLTVAHTPAGDALAGDGGKTLYTKSDEVNGTITCTGSCTSAWPPLVGSASAGSGVSGSLSTITRPDGSVQVTYNGSPLYYFSGDSAAGTASGQGVGGVWYIASPSGAGPGASAAASRGFAY